MRRFWLALVLTICLLFPTAARAQTPTPPPSAFQLCIDEKWGECAEKALQDYGIVGALFIILAVIMSISVRNKLEKVFEGVFSINPFAWALGLHRYLKVFIAEHRIFGFRGMESYWLKPIDLTNAYIQLDLNFSKLAEKDKRKKGDDSLPDKAMMQGREMKFNLAQISTGGVQKNCHRWRRRFGQERAHAMGGDDRRAGIFVSKIVTRTKSLFESHQIQPRVSALCAFDRPPADVLRPLQGKQTSCGRQFPARVYLRIPAIQVWKRKVTRKPFPPFPAQGLPCHVRWHG